MNRVLEHQPTPEWFDPDRPADEDEASTSPELARRAEAKASGAAGIDKIPWTALAGALVAAEDALARLDERLSRSLVRDGLVERSHFLDAAALLWLEGELVHVEDLVLHDAHMDIRAPTHELTRAHAVLRARRQIFANKPDWALAREGFVTLTGCGGKQAGDAEGWDGGGIPSSQRSTRCSSDHAPSSRGFP